MKKLLSTVALCLGILAVQAQSPSPTPVTTKPMVTTPTTAGCMATTEKEWNSIKVTGESLTKVTAIQARCTKEGKAIMNDAPRYATMMNKCDGEIKSTITAEQYTAWKKLCTPPPTTTPVKPEIKK